MSTLWESPVARVAMMRVRSAGDGGSTLFKNTWNSWVIWQHDYSIDERRAVELSWGTQSHIQTHNRRHANIYRGDAITRVFPGLVEEEKKSVSWDFSFLLSNIFSFWRSNILLMLLQKRPVGSALRDQTMRGDCDPAAAEHWEALSVLTLMKQEVRDSNQPIAPLEASR